jgi:UDP-3-O-[3-hydroxymyristoyl] glucosamine N-acyltransferase
VLGDGVVVGALAFVGRGSVVGAGSRLDPRASVLHGCVLGQRVVIGAGTVVGGDGFGFAPTREGAYEKIEQLGRVVLEDDVDIGCNSAIDRGALGDTVVGTGTKIDNLVQIAHNVTVGAHTVIAGCTGVAGSTAIGAHCRIGGGVGIVGHIRIADGTTLLGATQVIRTISKPGVYGGPFPFDDNAVWEKNAAALRKLHLLRQRVSALERSLQPAPTTPAEGRA